MLFDFSRWLLWSVMGVQLFSNFYNVMVFYRRLTRSKEGRLEIELTFLNYLSDGEPPLIICVCLLYLLEASSSGLIL